MAIERLLTGNLGSQVKELLATEDIMIEAVRDLVKDEIKSYIRNKVDSDEELKSENDWLNKGGKEGWELVNVIKDKSDIPSKHKMIYYFKREKIS